MSLEKATTPEGLRVYVDTIPTAQTTDINVFIGAGSVHEPEGLEGISHALEHCVHVSTEEFTTRESLEDFDNNHSLEANASTYYNRTVYTGAGPDLDPIMHHLSQILFHATYNPEYVANEMGVINREARTKLDKIEQLHFIAADYAQFGKPYGRRVLGHADKLDFSPEVLSDYYKRHYTLGNMAVVALGRARLDEVMTGIDNHFGQLETAKPQIELVEPHRLDALTTGLLREDSQSARIMVATPLDAEFVRTYLENSQAYDTALSAISQQCFRKLRYDAGISYDGGAYMDTSNNPNAWSLFGSVTTDNENIEEARAVFADVFRKPASSYTPVEIQSAIGSLKGETLRSMDKPEERIDMHIVSLQHGVEPVDLGTVADRIRNLSHEEVRTAIANIVAYLGNNIPLTHITGNSEAVRGVDAIIEQATIA